MYESAVATLAANKSQRAKQHSNRIENANLEEKIKTKTMSSMKKKKRVSTTCEQRDGIIRFNDKQSTLEEDCRDKVSK